MQNTCNKNPYIAEGNIADLNFIYHHYKKDFPSHERKDYLTLKSLLEKGQYKLLLLKHSCFEELLGYALIYDLTTLNTLWLDYIAINPNYRGSGYGTYFFQHLLDEFSSQINGIFLEVEIPNQMDSSNCQQQKRRIQFYEKRGAKKLDLKYLFPSPAGAFPMYLYFKTNLNLNVLPGSLVKQILAAVFKGLHSDVTKSNFTLQKNLSTVSEQVILS